MSSTHDPEAFAAVVQRGQLLIWVPVLMSVIAALVLMGGW